MKVSHNAHNSALLNDILLYSYYYYYYYYSYYTYTKVKYGIKEYVSI